MRVLFGFAVALAVTTAVAQQKKQDPPGTVYRQVTPNGMVIYTDKPNESHRIDRTLAPEPPVVSSPRPVAPTARLRAPSASNPGEPGTELPALPPLPGSSQLPAIQPLQPKTEPAAEPSAKPSASSSLDSIREAENALEKAKSAAREGEVPQPGERSGTVGGGSRLNEGYQKRQAALAAEVKAKETAVEDAYRKR